MQTPKLQKQIEKASERAKKNNRRENVVDLFITILDEDLKLQQIFERNGLDPKFICSNVENLFLSMPSFFEGGCLNEYNASLKQAKNISEHLENGFIDSEHVLHEIMLSETFRAWSIMAGEDMPWSIIGEEILDYIYLREPTEKDLLDLEDDGGDEFFENKYCTPFLGEDVNIFGREKEISQILDVLCRREKRNILLVGDPGVGRKSIAKGVSQRINGGRVSAILENAEVYSLDITSITAGTSMIGALEKRFKDLENELRVQSQTILVIDDIHLSFGAGSSRDGGMDCLSLLKPILMLPNVSCIGITTQADCKKTIERDKNLYSLFEKIKVEEPPKEEVKKIVLSNLYHIESYYKLSVEVNAVEKIVDLCEKFLPYQKFPLKAFDFLDQLAAKVKNRHWTPPEKITKSFEKIASDIINRKDGDKSKKLIDTISKKVEKWVLKTEQKRPIITAEMVLEEFSSRHNVPTSQLLGGGKSLETLPERIKQEVFGQDKAVDKVMDVLLCSKVGLRDKNKPIGKFFFIGSTGLGKTLLSRKIAEFYFDKENCFLKLDMSEYNSKESTWSLIGSPPGYKDSNEGGRLTEFVRNNPSCVVLFDEVEKAHESIHNLLLQIMDDGKITDATGNTIDFSNTIIILTGNSGSESPKVSIGFNSSNDGSHHTKAVERDFRPEFIARVDELIVFNPIDDTTMEMIVGKAVKETSKRLGGQNISFEASPEVLSHLIKCTKDDKSHARGIEKIVRQKLEVPLAKFIIERRPKKIKATFEEKINFIEMPA